MKSNLRYYQYTKICYFFIKCQVKYFHHQSSFNTGFYASLKCKHKQTLFLLWSCTAKVQWGFPLPRSACAASGRIWETLNSLSGTAGTSESNHIHPNTGGPAFHQTSTLTWREGGRDRWACYVLRSLSLVHGWTTSKLYCVSRVGNRDWLLAIWPSGHRRVSVGMCECSVTVNNCSSYCVSTRTCGVTCFNLVSNVPC